MIKINKINDITFVNAAVTDFSDSLGYCEYKIPLSIQGVKPKPSQALIQGTKAHHEKDVYEKEHVVLEPVTITEIKDEKKDIEFARENIYSTLTIPFEFANDNVVVSLPLTNSGNISLTSWAIKPICVPEENVGYSFVFQSNDTPRSFLIDSKEFFNVLIFVLKVFFQIFPV